MIAGPDTGLGLIAPVRPGREDLAAYQRLGGYRALAWARQQEPARVLAALDAAGVRGRGGSGNGRPVAEKWRRVLRAPGSAHHVIANGAESSPVSRKDRFLVARGPHRVLEGLLIAAHVLQAEGVYLYIRGDAPEALTAAEQALAEAAEAGLTAGVTVHLQPAFPSPVVGEESAVIDALEGLEGRPQPKPPFPEEMGLRGNPTLVQNVESFAAVAAALREGAERFRSLGTPDCPGTVLVTLSGAVARPGVYEVPYGTSLRELLRAAGAPQDVQAVLPGGLGSGPLRPDELEVPLDYDALAALGSSLGPAAVVLLGPETPLPQVLMEIARQYAEGSCGQCRGCQDGTARLAISLGATGEQPDFRSAREWAELLLHDRGNCAYPEGVARLVLRALTAFS